MTPAYILKALGFTLDAKFIPFDRSRNKDLKDDLGNAQLSLNWEVSLELNGHRIILTDYMAGSGHCSNIASNQGGSDGWMKHVRRKIARQECYTGFRYNFSESRDVATLVHPKSEIKPNISDVVYSLLMDSGVIDYDSFTDWSYNFGYDDDSIKAKAVYDACLEIALALKNHMSDRHMKVLQKAFQNY